HNMCPTVVLRDGKPILALGGAGGRKIPNAVFEVLLQYVGRDASLEDAIAAPRLHTVGGMNVTIEPKQPDVEACGLQNVGYAVPPGAVARVSAVAFEPKTPTCRAVAR